VTIHRYQVTLRHDGGRVTLTTAASSERAAIAGILAAERAPARAILEVVDLGPVPW